MLDIHTHVLPWTDDGALDLDMTRAMMQAAHKAGVRRIVATPHLLPGGAIEACHRHFEAAAQAAAVEGIRLYRGAEVRFDALRAYLENPAPICIGGTTHLLIEFFTEKLPTDAMRVLGDLYARGFSPVIAHPERYAFVQADLDAARDLIAVGCKLQVSAGALVRPWSAQEGRCARHLLDKGLAAYVASDAHRPGDYHDFARAHAKYASQWPGVEALEAALG